MRAVRGLLVGLGAAVGGYAVFGALTDSDFRPWGVLLFLGAVLAAHDAVLMPVAIGVGALIGRFVPARARPAVRGAALASLAVVVVAVPLVTGRGRSADNPSVLPLPYGRGLALTLAVIWTAAAVQIAAAALRSGRDQAAKAREHVSRAPDMPGP